MTIVVNDLEDEKVLTALSGGGVVVLRTDTLYGIIARADDKQAVERVYMLKSRNETKSPIVLISDTSQIYDSFDAAVGGVLDRVWPGKVSVIIPSTDAPTWIKRENQSVAYRLPDIPELQKLIARTGPLIAPSANPEGELPAMSIDEAQTYFGDAVDVYVDSGVVTDSSPSQIIKISTAGTVERIR